ncbi:MAG: hypothetical protein HY928_11655 [Elusimicrobia bacterium]|nr:hypothetical protein [Elusimicrobiota bacterium]
MDENRAGWKRIMRLCGICLAAAVGNASAQAGAGFPLNAPDAARSALSAARREAAAAPSRVAGQDMDGAQPTRPRDPVRVAIIRAAIDALSSGWRDTRVSGALRLLRMDPPPKEALGPLVRALRDDANYVRYYAILALARFVDLDEREPLVARFNEMAVEELARIMIQDSDRNCRLSAEEALAQIRARSQ